MENEDHRGGAPSAAPPPIADWCPYPAIHPTRAVGGRGGRLIDSQGREWLDLLSGWGSNILGYCHPAVTAAVREQLETYTGAGVPHPLGDRVTELLCSTIPCAEQVAFGKNGSDATSGAVRLARAVTGRERILFRGYHGFHDWYLASDPNCHGVPAVLRELIRPLSGNDLQVIADQLAESPAATAAIILDLGSLPTPSRDFLQDLSDLAHRHGTLMIFDEVGTGFRIAVGGAQEHFGVQPDLACFSKAMANGLPISALVGRSELMQQLPATRFGMTFAWDPISLAAAYATITTIRDEEVCDFLWAKGRRLKQAFQERAAELGLEVELAGMAPRMQIVFAEQGGLSEQELRWLFISELARDHILTTGLLLLNHGHSAQDMDQLAESMHRALGIVHTAVERKSLAGLMPHDLLVAVHALGGGPALPRNEGPPTGRALAFPPPVRSFRRMLPTPLRRGIRHGLAAIGLAQAPRPLELGLEERAHLPHGFDWQAYLSRYSDLHDAGIRSEVEAARHWLEHGATENRWCTRATYPPKPAMLCPSVHSVFMRAWGDLSCWDDAGSGETLQSYDEDVDYASEVYLGAVFNRIRKALYNNSMPFPENCTRCICLHSEVEHSSRHLDQKIVETFQVEPSYQCSLDCPGCVRRAVRRFAPRQHLELCELDKVLADFTKGGVTVHRFSFQGHGEPLRHPDISGLAMLVKRHYPRAYLSLATNAHGNGAEKLIEAGIDEFVCAIDGVDQESYEPYRVGGDFARALSFTAELARISRDGQNTAKVVWRYTLFEHNDSTGHLLAAQELARELGVDELVFVLTRNGPASTRVLRASQIPILDNGVAVSFRTHAPSPPELGRRLIAARDEIRNGNIDGAQNLLASVGGNLGRFFGDRASLGSQLEQITDELAQIIDSLPSAKACEIRQAFQHLSETRR